MALSLTSIEFARLQHAFAAAYKARNATQATLYACEIQTLMIAIVCGGVSL